MTDLITLTDIEDALGRTADPDEALQWQFYIGVVSNYINTYCDYGFEEVTETVRLKANNYGEIDLKRPVSAVTAINDFRYGPDLFADWDGLYRIYNLLPGQVVDVTYTHGFTTVPQDIVDTAITLVLDLVHAPDLVPMALTKYKVGDVEEDYAAKNKLATFIDDATAEVLDRYKVVWRSIPLADASYPDYVGNSQFLMD